MSDGWLTLAMTSGTADAAQSTFTPCPCGAPHDDEPERSFAPTRQWHAVGVDAQPEGAAHMGATQVRMTLDGGRPAHPRLSACWRFACSRFAFVESP